MNEELERIKRLAEIARKEAPPEVEVTDAVMQRIAALREPMVRFWPYAAVVSGATAAAFLLFLQAWLASTGTLIEFFRSVKVVMQ